MADSLSRRTRVRPPRPGVAGAGTMDDRRQLGEDAIVAAPGEAAAGWRLTFAECLQAEILLPASSAHGAGLLSIGSPL